MSPVARPRRTTRLRYAGHGMLAGRVEDELRLWSGMKDRHAFVVPARGRWEFLYRGATYRQGPGMVQLKQPGEIYRDLRRDGPATYDIVLLDPEVVSAAREASARAAEVVFETPQLAASDPRADALLALCRLVERARRPKDGVTDTMTDGLAIESAVAEAALALVSLGAPQRPVGGEQRAVQRARAYLLERLAERVRLDEVADHVRVDKFHLIRAFRAQVGVPPYEFLTHARVHRARELLRRGGSAAAVATAVGFCDQSQLHRHFVRLVGVTPGRYTAHARSSLRVSITLATSPPRAGALATGTLATARPSDAGSPAR
ncbi:MAG TPA: AraC family transcriptional regulator [Kofleriaceae bacterium]|nr:AraC family transcriptional regulator [Kofleriaceae bacterium]